MELHSEHMAPNYAVPMRKSVVVTRHLGLHSADAHQVALAPRFERPISPLRNPGLSTWHGTQARHARKPTSCTTVAEDGTPAEPMFPVGANSCRWFPIGT